MGYLKHNTNIQTYKSIQLKPRLLMNLVCRTKQKNNLPKTSCIGSTKPQN